MSVDGREIDFAEGFADLHTRVYAETLAGRGFTIADARPSIDLVHHIRTDATVAPGGDAHPLLRSVR
jgi:UDP-N-acetyl-2-amino-2-deoxyglucuronate dehydrogenase